MHPVGHWAGKYAERAALQSVEEQQNMRGVAAAVPAQRAQQRIYPHLSALSILCLFLPHLLSCTPAFTPMMPAAPRPKGLGPFSNGAASPLAERRSAGAASGWPRDAEQLLGPDLAAYMRALAAQAGCHWTMVLAPALAAAAAALGPHATITVRLGRWQ